MNAPSRNPEFAGTTHDLETILARFRIGVWEWDAAADSVRWDATVREIYGLGRDDAVSYAFWAAAIHPEDREAAEAAVFRTVREGDNFEIAYRVVRPDGLVRIVRSAGAAARLADGRIHRIIGITRDVTDAQDISSETARQHELLRLNERRLRLLVESVPDHAMYALDPGGRVSSWNLGAKRMKGYRAQEILGEDFACFFTREDVADGVPAAALAEARRVGEYKAEGLRVRKDGSRFWAGVAIVALRDGDDTFAGFAKITRDLTERLAEEEYRRLIVEASPNGMILVDEDGRVTFANSAAEKMFGV